MYITDTCIGHENRRVLFEGESPSCGEAGRVVSDMSKEQQHTCTKVPCNGLFCMLIENINENAKTGEKAVSQQSAYHPAKRT